MVTVSGWFVGTSRDEAAEAADRLASLLADGGFGDLVVSDPSVGDRWVRVQLLDSAPEVDWDDDRWLRFSVDLRCPSSVRYGAMSSASTPFPSSTPGAGLRFPLFTPGGAGQVLDFGELPATGRVVLLNPGNSPASPVFEVSGPTPASGFYVLQADTGARITFESPVPTGSVLRIDSRDGSAVIDGVADRSGDLLVDAWPNVPAGESAEFLFAPVAESSAATLTVSVTATYW